MKIWKILLLITTIILSIFFYIMLTFSHPYVDEIKASWLTNDEIAIKANATVINPNFFSIRITKLNYSLFLNDVEIAHGINENVVLHPEKNNVGFQLILNYGNLQKWWASHIKNNEYSIVIVKYNAIANFLFFKKSKEIKEEYTTISTNFISKLSLYEPKPVNVSIYGKNTMLLIINKFESRWQYVDENITIINSTIQFYNPNEGDVKILNLTYDIFLNGIKMGNGSLKEVTIPPYGMRETFCLTYIYNEKIPEWFESHIRNGENTTYEIKSNAQILYDESIYLAEPLNIKGNFTTNFLNFELEKVL